MQHLSAPLDRFPSNIISIVALKKNGHYNYLHVTSTVAMQCAGQRGGWECVLDKNGCHETTAFYAPLEPGCLLAGSLQYVRCWIGFMLRN